MKKAITAGFVVLLVSVMGMANATGKYSGHKRVCIAGYVHHENGKGRVVWSRHLSGKSFRDHTQHGDRYRCTKWSPKKRRGGRGS